jgi:hypothetical protein
VPRLTDHERQSVISYLTANSEAWQQAGDREILNGFSDDKLVALQQAAEQEQHAITVANAAVNGFADDGNAYRVNPQTGKWEKRVVANAKKDDEEDEPDDNEEMDEEDYTPKKNRRRESTSNASSRIRTFEDLIRASPAHLREQVENTLRTAQEVEQREKDRLITQILVNVADSEKRQQYDRLQRYTVEELQNTLALIPRIPPEEQGGRASPTTNRTARPRQDDDMLVAPTINWQEVGNGGTGTTGGEGNRQGAGGGGGGYVENVDDPASDEEWLRNAPPRARQMVQNAMVIEAREKRKLIEELTANVTDEDAERRLISRLQHKSLDELRDLVALTPKLSGSSRPNYFGSAGAPLTNTPRTSATDVDEDVLPLPTINWSEEAQKSATGRRTAKS